MNSFRISTLRTIGFLFTLLFLSGCLAIKPGGVRSGKNLFQTFFVGEEGTQYFIKPLTLSSEESKDEIVMDFTFRYKNEVKDSVNVNFSLLSSLVYKSVDRLTLSNKDHTIVSEDMNLLFNEKYQKSIISRFSTKFSLAEFNQMFDNPDWISTVSVNGTELTFFPDKKTKKAIDKLQEKVFILLQ